MKRKTKHHIKPLGTIAGEKAACIAAFRKYPQADYAWCLHHEIMVELITAAWDMLGGHDWMGRVRYIANRKDRKERAIRFRNFRPYKGKPRRKGGRLYFSHAELNRQWPDNTWDGQTIFSALAKRLKNSP